MTEQTTETERPTVVQHEPGGTVYCEDYESVVVTAATLPVAATVTKDVKAPADTTAADSGS